MDLRCCTQRAVQTAAAEFFRAAWPVGVALGGRGSGVIWRDFSADGGGRHFTAGVAPAIKK